MTCAAVTWVEPVSVVRGRGSRNRRSGRMALKRLPHPTIDERNAVGRNARERTPASSHYGWRPAVDRSDPVALLEEQDLTREPDLVPVRHGRMMVSPFTFYRGAAKIMAADLAGTPTAGLDAQLCGDAHLSNFGVFGSPERQLLFDVNDFDETLPGPFEYDVKRMAASFMIAGKNNGFAEADARAATAASVTAYREAMAEFAGMGTMDIWYSHLSEGEIMGGIRSALEEVEKQDEGKKRGKGTAKREAKQEAKTARQVEKRAEKVQEKARTHDSLQALSKLGELVDGQYRIVSQPPIVVPARDLAATFGMSPDEVGDALREQLRAYRATLEDDRRHLLERSRSWIWPARSLVSAASAPARSSCCSRDATLRTRCSCRSRRPPLPCWRIICRRAGTSSTASVSCAGSG